VRLLAVDCRDADPAQGVLAIRYVIQMIGPHTCSRTTPMVNVILEWADEPLIGEPVSDLYFLTIPQHAVPLWRLRRSPYPTLRFLSVEDNKDATALVDVQPEALLKRQAVAGWHEGGISV
jgi:hypothetical protein